MSRLEAKVENLVSDRISLLEDKISQSFETLTNQLTISNTEVAKEMTNEERERMMLLLLMALGVVLLLLPLGMK